MTTTETIKREKTGKGEGSRFFGERQLKLGWTYESNSRSTFTAGPGPWSELRRYALTSGKELPTCSNALHASAEETGIIAKRKRRRSDSFQRIPAQNPPQNSALVRSDFEPNSTLMTSGLHHRTDDFERQNNCPPSPPLPSPPPTSLPSSNDHCTLSFESLSLDFLSRI